MDCPCYLPVLHADDLTGLDASTMNYASVVFAGFAAISIIWYFVWGRKHFSGPPILKSEMAENGVGVVRGQSLDEEVGKREASSKEAVDPKAA